MDSRTHQNHQDLKMQSTGLWYKLTFIKKIGVKIGLDKF